MILFQYQRIKIRSDDRFWQIIYQCQFKAPASDISEVVIIQQALILIDLRKLRNLSQAVFNRIRTDTVEQFIDIQIDKSYVCFAKLTFAITRPPAEIAS